LEKTMVATTLRVRVRVRVGVGVRVRGGHHLEG